MRDKIPEQDIMKYFELQESCFILPREDNIKAFDTKSEKVSADRKIPFRIKAVAIIAACMALVIGTLAVIPAFRQETSLGTEPDASVVEPFGSVKRVEGIADWYKPGTLDIETVLLKSPSAARMNTITDIRPMTLKAANEQIEILPDWVTGVIILNERYAKLSYVFLPNEYNHGYLLYDLYENKIVSLVEKISPFLGDLRDTTNCDTISIEHFGKNPDWCIFRVWDKAGITLERYLINIENGELIKLPTNDIVAISEDYQSLIFSKDKYSNGKFISRTISYFDVQSKAEKEIITTERGTDCAKRHSKFLDERYIISYMNSGAHSADSIHARWRIYDTETGSIHKCQGKILGLTKNEDAIIVTDRHGTKIYRLSDMTDVTDSYPLETCDKYELSSEQFNGKNVLYLNPLFENGEKTEIADNIRWWYVWNDYIYIYCYKSTELIVYSIEHHEYFCREISGAENITPNDNMAIFVTDSGKNCRLVVYPNYDPENENSVR